MEKVKAAIIGLGRIASILEDDALREKPCTHAGAIAANGECELVCGCDIDEERRSHFRQKWQVPVFDDAKEMLREHSPQILAVATHPDSHYRYCKLGVTAKIPVIICEKPLADTLEKAKKIVRLSDKSGTKILTNHERRYSKDYIRAKEIISGGELGVLASVRAVLYMGKNRRLVDQFWHDGTHLADAVMFLTGGKLKHRRKWGAKFTSRTGTAWLEGELLLKDKTSCPILFEIGAERDHLVFEMEFSFEKGRLRIGNGVFEIWKSVSSPYAENFRSLQKDDETFSGNTNYFSNMLEDAVKCVREPEHKPVSSAADGLRVIKYLNSVRSWR